MHRVRTATFITLGAALAATPSALAATAAPSPLTVDRQLHAAAQAAARSAPAPREQVTGQALIDSTAFVDSQYDTTLAPDLQAMAVGTTDAGELSVLIRLDTNALIPGDSVATYIDTDANPATGSATFDGADLVVMVLGQYGTDSVATLRWDGTRMSAVSNPASLVSIASGTTDEFWTASLTDLGITPGTRIGVHFATLYTGIYSNYFDWAPEPGQGAFGVDIPVPTPVTPAPTTPTTTTTTTPVTTTPAATTPTPTAAVATVTPAADAPAVAITGFRVRRTGGNVAVRVAWGGATTLPVAYRLAVRCGTRTRNFGGFATKGVVIARTIPVRAVCGRRPVQVRATLGDGTMGVSAVRTAR